MPHVLDYGQPGLIEAMQPQRIPRFARIPGPQAHHLHHMKFLTSTATLRTQKLGTTTW
jgi:hypothetical protein